MPEPALTKRVHRVKACIALKTLIMPMALPLGVVAAMALSAGQALAAKATYPGGVWEPGPARYGATVTDDVPVTMDDGVVLNASIAYPTDLASGRRARGPFPVVVEHMPYVQFAVPVKVNPFFAEHGYISVQVRARGLGKSGGEVQFLSPREGLDGKAIIDSAVISVSNVGSHPGKTLAGCSYSQELLEEPEPPADAADADAPGAD